METDLIKPHLFTKLHPPNYSSGKTKGTRRTRDVPLVSFQDFYSVVCINIAHLQKKIRDVEGTGISVRRLFFISYIKER